MTASNAALLTSIADNDELLEVGRKAVEDTLIEFRDMRLSVLGRNNGLVVKEYDGKPSSIIRITTEHAVAIALRAIAEAI